jgi:hypothetical protein
LVSILGILWLWHDTGDAEQMAAPAQMTFSCVLPTFPIFLLMPALLRHGIGFWSTLAACCMLTFVLYLGTIWTLGKYEMTL